MALPDDQFFQRLLTHNDELMDEFRQCRAERNELLEENERLRKEVANSFCDKGSPLLDAAKAIADERKALCIERDDLLAAIRRFVWARSRLHTIGTVNEHFVRACPDFYGREMNEARQEFDSAEAALVRLAAPEVTK